MDQAAVSESVSPHAFLMGGGKIAGIIAEFDWSLTPLGPIETWPASLKTTVGLILRSPVAIVTLWGEQGTMIYNDAYSEFAAARHPRLLGSAVREGWPEVADFNDNIMKVVLGRGETISYRDFELVLYRRDVRESVWFNLDYSPVLDENGARIGVIAIVVEITEAHHATARLRQNETRLRFLDALAKETAKTADADTILATTTAMLGKHMGVSICAYADMDRDQDGFTIRGDWSAPGSPSIVGHYSLTDFGELAVRNLHAGVPLVVNDNLKELPPAAAATFQRIGIGSTICMPLVKEGRLTALMAVHKKGPHQWTEDELALTSEVTERSWAHIERVRSEAEVRAGEQRFRAQLEMKVEERTAALAQSEKNIRTIFETSHLYQGLMAIDGTLYYANATSLAGIKVALEDVAGQLYWQTPWFASTPGMPEQIRAAVARVATGEAVNFHTSLNLPIGTRSFDFSIRPVKDDTGKVVAMVPEAVDTTARVHAEQALLQSQKVEIIGNLAGGVAHDFNNLLMAILGSLELLRKRLPDDPTLLRLVDTATEGARRGRSLTSRMLAFARRQDLKPERTDLAELVSGMTELMRRSLGPTIAIEVQMPAGLPAVEIDPNQLEAALLNLVVNARDAMQGKGALVITAREEHVVAGHDVLKPGRYICLSVCDDGDGMSEATLKRATEPFFTTKGVGKGTGLGLSMVQGLAQQSGGMLTLTSQVGKGTTIEIWLPAIESDQLAQAKRLPKAIAQPISAMEPLSVLAVDDDPLILMSTVDMLEDLGHKVLSVTSGREALQQLMRTKFDLLVTDHAMPRMTGAQLVAEVQARFPQIAIVLATGYADLPPGENVNVPRVSKPFSQAELAEALALARRRVVQDVR
jgi:signal transduction histidine kinase/CheY-like chemotaxis protein